MEQYKTLKYISIKIIIIILSKENPNINMKQYLIELYFAEYEKKDWYLENSRVNCLGFFHDLSSLLLMHFSTMVMKIEISSIWCMIT